ncbi:MAG: hypothetical protein R3F14_42625 [Polyangiaceae bacterium]
MSGPTATIATGKLTAIASAGSSIATPSTAARFSRPTQAPAAPRGSARSPHIRSVSARSTAQSRFGGRTPAANR